MVAERPELQKYFVRLSTGIQGVNFALGVDVCLFLCYCTMYMCALRRAYPSSKESYRLPVGFTVILSLKPSKKGRKKIFNASKQVTQRLLLVCRICFPFRPPLLLLFREGKGNRGKLDCVELNISSLWRMGEERYKSTYSILYLLFRDVQNIEIIPRQWRND
jgi:hypothetical protein